MGLAVIKRVASGLAVGALWAVGLLFAPPIVLFVALLGCALICQWEFYRLAACGGYQACPVLGLVLGGVWMTAIFVAGARDAALESVLMLGGGGWLLLRLLFDSRVKRPIEAAAITLLGFGYVPFLMGFYVHLAHEGATEPMTFTRGGIFLAFYASLVVKMTDVGAYAVGTACGRHKMFPRISPAKSWEGLAGGLFLGVLSSVLLVLLARHWAVVPETILARMSLVMAAGVGLLLGGIGVLGDLVESMFKRSAQVKDSSGILPAIGGLLDVFDSLLLVPAVFYLLLPLLARI
jgi:phosphatidate cytidylyltransferase